MNSHGYYVDVKYWNIVIEDFQKKFLENKNVQFDDTLTMLLPIMNFLWVKYCKNLSSSNFKNKLLSINPSWYNFESDYVENKMIQYSNEFEKIITNEILKMNLDVYDIFGISAKFSQWICGGIIANKVKEMYPKIKIVLGGLGTSDEAIAMMNNFDYYDYAIWGEGEYPLLNLCESFETKSFDDVPFLIFRNINRKPQISVSKKKEYFDLNSGIYPDYFST